MHARKKYTSSCVNRSFRKQHTDSQRTWGRGGLQGKKSIWRYRARTLLCSERSWSLRTWRDVPAKGVTKFQPSTLRLRAPSLSGLVLMTHAKSLLHSAVISMLAVHNVLLIGSSHLLSSDFFEGSHKSCVPFFCASFRQSVCFLYFCARFEVSNCLLGPRECNHAVKLERPSTQ